MYSFAIDSKDKRRCTSLLDNRQELTLRKYYDDEHTVDFGKKQLYDDIKDDGEGFTHYFFDLPEEEFTAIVVLIKTNGMTPIGVDDQLTENKIMKLTDLIKEWNTTEPEERSQLFPPGENGFVDLIGALEKTLKNWKDKYINGYYTDEKNRADDYMLDITELLEIYKENLPKRSSDDGLGDYNSKDGSHLNEQKVRKAIRKLIRQ